MTNVQKRNRQPIDHCGNHYDTFSDMCKHYDISRETFFIRRRKGWSTEECLLGKQKEKTIQDHKGNFYATKTEMCEAYGTTLKTFNANQKRGWSLEDSLCGKGKTCRKQSQQRKKQISKDFVTDHFGHIYKSERQLCETYGIAWGTYRNRRDQGYSKPEILGAMPLINVQTKNLIIDENMIIICAIAEHNGHNIMADWYECKINERDAILHHDEIISYYLENVMCTR